MSDKKDPVIIADEFAAELSQAFGDGLISLFLTGSAARGDYIPGKSDINTLLILTPDGVEWPEKANPALKKHRYKKVAVPHFMTENAIDRALDSYPLEFLDFKTFHKLIKGKNVLEGLQIPPKPLRLQIERELRGKLFLLRRILAAEVNNEKELRRTLVQALATLTAVFQGILELCGKTIPRDRLELFQAAAEAAGFSDRVFRQIFDVRSGKKGQNTKVVFKDLMTEMTRIVDWVDGFEVDGD